MSECSKALFTLGLYGIWRSNGCNNQKKRLKKQGLENEEIGARVTKLLAEVEKERAIAAKTRAETEALEFALLGSRRKPLSGGLSRKIDSWRTYNPDTTPLVKAQQRGADWEL